MSELADSIRQLLSGADAPAPTVGGLPADRYAELMEAGGANDVPSWALNGDPLIRSLQRKLGGPR